MLFRRGQFDVDLEEEMRLHLELREQEKLQAGLTQPARTPPLDGSLATRQPSRRKAI